MYDKKKMMKSSKAKYTYGGMAKKKMNMGGYVTEKGSTQPVYKEAMPKAKGC
jgi:hypothetical protein